MSIDTKKYAQDLYELAVHDDKLELYRAELERLNHELNINPELNSYFDSVNNSASDKKAKIEYLNINSEVISTYFVMVQAINKSRVELQLIHDFLAYYYFHEKKIFGTVYSVRELDDKTITAVEKAVESQLGRKVKLENKLDKELLGGIKVVVNNNVWDGSYKTKLKDLRKNLLTSDEELKANSKELSKQIQSHIDTFEKNNVNIESNETLGYVTSVADGIINISGCYGAMASELLTINDATAMVMNLEEENIGAVVLSGQTSVSEGSIVKSTGNVVQVPVGDALLGRVINAIGEPLDNKGPLKNVTYAPIESNAPGVLDRQSVNEPLETGLMIIDSMIPIGKGQRELIIGDRQTGKTAIAIDAILNQQGKNVKCIYVAIGQKNSTVAQIVKKLSEEGAMSYTTVVMAGASDLPALQYIAPYAGTAIGEYFMNRGDDVLIVYDDLSKHAVAYRTLSLLLRRPPGREAYPGDVFYLHSRLLERSAKLSEEKGGGSMTALPIVETLAGDISAYIPTNVISITDGQIFLQTELFNSGNRPAVDSGLSVSRVGSAAQYKAMKKVSSSLKLDLAQYQEVLAFSQFGSDLDAATRKTINHGSHLIELLKQPQYSPIAIEDQIILLYANQKGYIDQIEKEKVKDYSRTLLLEVHSSYPDVIRDIVETKVISNENEEILNSVINEITERFKASK